MIKLDSSKDRDMVLYVGPHLFYGKPMIVKQWTSSFNFYKEVLKIISIWVKLPNVPLNCWSKDSLSRIGNLLGVALYNDECTSKMLRVSFVRICLKWI